MSGRRLRRLRSRWAWRRRWRRRLEHRAAEGSRRGVGGSRMARQRVKFTFPPDLVTQPVVYNMGKEFQVVTNIRRANVSGDRGWVILEISGSDDDIARALDWAKDQGVRIESEGE